jgi:hypothetical protein
MEFIPKSERLLLIAVAQGGPNGVSYTTLYNTLSLFLSRETFQRSLESLYIKGLISIFKIDDQIKIIANKTSRIAIANLEFQKSRILKVLQEVKKSLEEFKDKTNIDEELTKLINKILVALSSSFILLLNEMPELTLPEFIEFVSISLKEILTKLIQRVQKLDKDSLEALAELFNKYVGEEESKVIKQLIEKM